VITPPAGPTSADADRAEGYAEGLRQGLADASARIASELSSRQRHLEAQFEQAEAKRAAEHARRLASLDGVVQGFAQSRDALVRAIEADAVSLAFEAVCKVLGPESGRGELLSSLVRQGLAKLHGQAVMRIRLHPRDLDELQASSEGRALSARQPGLQWTADPSLQRSSCLLDTDRGTLDASLQTQLGRLAQLWAAVEVEE
jgi:flagellar assembly protein FliH